MFKLILILIMSGALAGTLPPSDPPLLIDSAPSGPVVTLDVGN
jgi:hypothetical protein